MNDLLKKYSTTKFSELPKKRRDKDGKLIDESEEMQRLKVFQNIKNKPIKINLDKKRTFKGEFSGLSPKDLINLMGKK